MIKRHKWSRPLLEGLILSESTSQFTELQLRQRNLEVDPAMHDPRPSKGQTPLLPDNQCQDCNHIASPHQPCRSGVGRPTPWVKTPAYSDHTTIIQTENLRSNDEFYTTSIQANTYETASLTRENNFNRLSIPLCQRSYDASIFMHVIHGDISDVYSIIRQSEGSL